MKHNFPQVDLPVEMLAWRDVTEDILNLYRQSCRLKACIFALCTEGTITASINLMEHEIKKNDLIILMPGTILQLNEQVEKVRLCFVGFSSHCVNGINLLQATMGSFSKIWDNPIVNVSDLIASYFVDYFALLTRNRNRFSVVAGSFYALFQDSATSAAESQSVPSISNMIPFFIMPRQLPFRYHGAYTYLRNPPIRLPHRLSFLLLLNLFRLQ